ncbi:hypothetical protein TUM4644_23420 [Shewanella colwelliana]|nr:hypothetical protein TUM4644_23420 [Shewanella colwelliana]
MIESNSVNNKINSFVRAFIALKLRIRSVLFSLAALNKPELLASELSVILGEHSVKVFIISCLQSKVYDMP